MRVEEHVARDVAEVVLPRFHEVEVKIRPNGEDVEHLAVLGRPLTLASKARSAASALTSGAI